MCRVCRKVVQNLAICALFFHQRKFVVLVISRTMTVLRQFLPRLTHANLTIHKVLGESFYTFSTDINKCNEVYIKIII